MASSRSASSVPSRSSSSEVRPGRRRSATAREDGVPAHAPGTVRNVHATLRTAFGYGVRMGMARTNPALNVDLPRARRQEMVFLTRDEVVALAEAVHPHFRVLVYTAAWTGLRAGELGGLQVCDLNLLRGALTVARSLEEVAGHDGPLGRGLALVPTKTYAVRSIALPAPLVTMLREHLATLPNPNDPTAPVFTNRRGGLLRHGAFYNRYFRRAVLGNAKKDIPPALPAAKRGCRFHDLRHTCAALSIATGAHPKMIQTRLGHSSITVTLDRYGHLFDSLEETLAERLGALWEAPAEETASNVIELAR
jgi:integrase